MRDDRSSPSSKIKSYIFTYIIFKHLMYYRRNKILISFVLNIIIMFLITRFFFVRSDKKIWATKNTLTSITFPELFIVEKLCVWVAERACIFLLHDYKLSAWRAKLSSIAFHKCSWAFISLFVFASKCIVISIKESSILKWISTFLSSLR